jgi:hypothetical protein
MAGRYSGPPFFLGGWIFPIAPVAQKKVCKPKVADYNNSWPGLSRLLIQNVRLILGGT